MLLYIITYYIGYKTGHIVIPHINNFCEKNIHLKNIFISLKLFIKDIIEK